MISHWIHMFWLINEIGAVICCINEWMCYHHSHCLLCMQSNVYIDRFLFCFVFFPSHLNLVSVSDNYKGNTSATGPVVYTQWNLSHCSVEQIAHQLNNWNWNQNVRIIITFGVVFKFNLCVFDVEFQLLAKTKGFRPKSVAIFRKLSKIIRFIAKRYLWTAKFIRVRFSNAINEKLWKKLPKLKK